MTDQILGADIPHHTQTFANLPQKKKNRIIQTAIKEFAAQGFSRANINQIAQKAQISVGALYKYFPSKEALFLTIIDHGHQLLKKELNKVDLSSTDIFTKLENMFQAALRFAQENPEMNQIYLELASEGLSHLANKTSRQMESITAEYYRQILTKAQKQGQVRNDLEVNIAAFCLDNLLVLLQYSFASQYLKQRMEIFLQAANFAQQELVKGIMDFIRQGLSPEQA